MKIKNKIIVGILPLLLILFTVSCANDDDTVQSFNITQLEGRIADAENLIAIGVEGVNAGDYQPGSKDDLQDVVNWIYWRIDNSKSQANIDDAVLKLNAAIETFLASTVSEAFPWVKQEADSGIDISENIKPVFNNPFTIEMQIYIVDLNALSFLGNVFSMVEEPAEGFGVRYWPDGQIEIYVGVTTGWPEGEAPVGTMKSGEWIDVAFTNTGDKQELYINGELLASLEATHAVATDVPFRIGNSPTFTSRVSNALYKEFKVWNSVLDQATIQANIGATLGGTEAGLECYFPFSSNLGDSFTDVTGNYTATLTGAVEWVTGPPVIVVDYSALNTSIQNITDFMATVVEGTENGDFPVGTIAYLQSVADAASDIVTNEGNQKEVDAAVEQIADALGYANSNKVQDSDGIMIALDNADAVGYLISPEYAPGTSSFTIEISTKLNSLKMGNIDGGEIINNGAYLLRYYGENEAGDQSPNYGKLSFFVNNAADGSWNNLLTPIAVMLPDVWINIAAVFDSSAGQQTIYINGVEVASANFGVNEVSGGWGAMWLGNGWLKMNGSVKNVRIWSRALFPGELGADVVGSEADLEMYYPLTKVSAKVAPDETGNYSGEVRGVTWNKL